MIRRISTANLVSIGAALCSVGIYYATHIEYFKIFIILFVLAHCGRILFMNESRTGKIRNVGVLLAFGIITYVIATVLWR